MRLVQFTRTCGDPIWFNPDHIVVVEPSRHFTLITMGEDRYLVREPIEDVIEQLRWGNEPVEPEGTR